VAETNFITEQRYQGLAQIHGAFPGDEILVGNDHVEGQPCSVIPQSGNRSG
jgi:hypothetical protein